MKLKHALKLTGVYAIIPFLIPVFVIVAIPISIAYYFKERYQ